MFDLHVLYIDCLVLPIQSIIVVYFQTTPGMYRTTYVNHTTDNSFFYNITTGMSLLT